MGNLGPGVGPVNDRNGSAKLDCCIVHIFSAKVQRNTKHAAAIYNQPSPLRLRRWKPASWRPLEGAPPTSDELLHWKCAVPDLGVEVVSSADAFPLATLSGSPPTRRHCCIRAGTAPAVNDGAAVTKCGSSEAASPSFVQTVAIGGSKCVVPGREAAAKTSPNPASTTSMGPVDDPSPNFWEALALSEAVQHQ